MLLSPDWSARLRRKEKFSLKQEPIYLRINISWKWNIDWRETTPQTVLAVELVRKQQIYGFMRSGTMGKRENRLDRRHHMMTLPIVHYKLVIIIMIFFQELYVWGSTSLMVWSTSNFSSEIGCRVFPCVLCAPIAFSLEKLIPARKCNKVSIITWNSILCALISLCLAPCTFLSHK